jgi:hypothetical protein
MRGLFSTQLLYCPAHGLPIWVAQGVGGSGTVSHGNSDGALLAGNRQVHRVRNAALPDLELSLWPEAFILQRDEQAVSAGSIQVVDLLGGGESVPGALNECDSAPAQAVDGELQLDHRSQLELVVGLVGAGMVGLIRE